VGDKLARVACPDAMGRWPALQLLRGHRACAHQVVDDEWMPLPKPLLLLLLKQLQREHRGRGFLCSCHKAPLVCLFNKQSLCRLLPHFAVHPQVLDAQEVEDEQEEEEENPEQFVEDDEEDEEEEEEEEVGSPSSYGLPGLPCSLWPGC